jgi:hypothetical protein
MEAMDKLTTELRLWRVQADNYERNQLKVIVLTEEYKARWQQLMSWDEQSDKLMASYAIALVVAVSWILGTERFSTLAQLFSGRDYDNSYFILSLALVNAVYILYVTFKGYQIHQMRLYLYKEVVAPLNDITDSQAHQWEAWHRTVFQSRRKGKPEWRRLLYYPIITIAPFLVSAFVLWSYFQYAGRSLQNFDRHNIYFYFVTAVQLAGLVLSISVTQFNNKWKAAIDLKRNSIQRNEPEATVKTGSLRDDSSSATGAEQWNDSQIKTVAADLRRSEEAAPYKKSAHYIPILSFTLLVGYLLLALKSKDERTHD